MNEQSLIPRQTLFQMAEAYQQAASDIEEMYSKMEAAKNTLRQTFAPAESYRFGFDIELHRQTFIKKEDLMLEIKKDVWKCLIERMELRKLMSLADIAALDEQLRTGKDLPDITAGGLIAMLEGTMANIPNMIEKAVKEVFDFLLPRGWALKEYKTNQKSEFALTEKVIIRYCVQIGYNGNYKVGSHKQDQLRAVDNVFHSLDGKGIAKGYYGPLIEKIDTTPISEGQGETEYFRFKCYRNQNLHLEFKRMDLVQRLNAVAGGMRLKDAR